MTLVDVYCGLPNGLVLYHGDATVTLRHGFNADCDAATVNAWLVANKHLAVVKHGTVRVVERMAQDCAS